MKKTALSILWALFFVSAYAVKEPTVTKATFQITDEYTLPVPVYIGKGIEYVDQLQFAIHINKMFIDGEEVKAVETSAVVESDIVAVRASGTMWHSFQLSFGEYSNNLLPGELPWDNFHFYNWKIPEDWQVVKIEYSFHDSVGKIIENYEVVYTKAAYAQQGDGSDVDR